MKQAEHNPDRRVRFQLPGRWAAIENAIITGPDVEPDFADLKRDALSLETPRNKKMRITPTVQEAPTPATNPVDPAIDISKVLDVNDVLPTKDKDADVQSDPSSWVNRIMHPCMSPPCCPETWDQGQGSAVGGP